MRIRGLAVIALSACLLSVSCKRTVEGENKAWDRNVQHVQELTAIYPGFANALKEQLKNAQDAMAAARAISDKEASAKKMGEANSLIDGGFISSLGQIDSKTKALRDKVITVGTEATNPADQAGARAASDEAQRILKVVDDQVKAGAADAASAGIVLRKIDADLMSATANVDRVLTAAKQRKADAAKAAAASPAPGAAGGGPVAKVQWKCTYCNHMNDDARTKCENCGAPRPAPKAPPKLPPKKK